MVLRPRRAAPIALAVLAACRPPAPPDAIDPALSGAPDLIAAATAAHPAAGILAQAESVAAASPVWIAVRGGVALPMEGNLANVNNLLRDIEYVTLAVQPGDPTQLALVARCPSPEAALRFEQSFRRPGLADDRRQRASA